DSGAGAAPPPRAPRPPPLFRRGPGRRSRTREARPPPPPPPVQVSGGRQSIPPIVAPAADDVSAIAALPSHLPACGLHQPADRDRETPRRQLVDLADLGATQRRDIRPVAGRERHSRGHDGGWMPPVRRWRPAASREGAG